MLKSNKGVTLVALVITIIVLLILAGVSISLVVGDNGVLSNATNAADKTNQASVESAVGLAISSAQTQFLSDKYSGNGTNAGKNFSEVCTVADLTKYIDTNEYTVAETGTALASGGLTVTYKGIKYECTLTASTDKTGFTLKVAEDSGTTSTATNTNG